MGAAVSQFAFGTDSARDSAGRVAVLPAAPGRLRPTQWKPVQEPTNSH
ncbi:Penicillin-binding protein 1C (fragment) [Cupriavidus taiwanensis]|uniref:Penicillin-binding protein 1C n=1 Tax=Cupriavidus taiwanensis TaxID=164546 RepID=A0A975XFC7_9BURK